MGRHFRRHGCSAGSPLREQARKLRMPYIKGFPLTPGAKNSTNLKRGLAGGQIIRS